MKNPSSLSEEKLRALLEAFSLWYEKHEMEGKYPEDQRKKATDLKETFLNVEYLRGLLDEALAKRINDYSRKLSGQTGR